MESLGISKVGQTVLARLIESQIWYQLPGSVEGGLKKGTVVSAHLSVWEKAVHWLLLDARHLSSSLLATGAFQADTLVVLVLKSASE